MEIAKYRTMLDEDRHNVLVKEGSIKYGVERGDKIKLSTPCDVAHMMENCFELSGRAEEYAYMIALDIANRPLGVFEVSHGTASMSILNTREIFIRALLCGAMNIMVVHNHPSGDTYPSKEDIRTTKKIKSAGDIMCIKLLDHVIVGGGTYTSFMEEGLL